MNQTVVETGQCRIERPGPPEIQRWTRHVHGHGVIQRAFPCFGGRPQRVDQSVGLLHQRQTDITGPDQRDILLVDIRNAFDYNGRITHKRPQVPDRLFRERLYRSPESYLEGDSDIEILVARNQIVHREAGDHRPVQLLGVFVQRDLRPLKPLQGLLQLTVVAPGGSVERVPELSYDLRLRRFVGMQF